MSRTINFRENKHLQIIFGKYDQNIRLIEKELKYPGRIKVTLIRETRIVEYAK